MAGFEVSPEAAMTRKLTFRTRILSVVPDLIATVLPPFDRRPFAKTRILEWITNDAARACRIDGDARTVTICRPH